MTHKFFNFSLSVKFIEKKANFCKLILNIYSPTQIRKFNFNILLQQLAPYPRVDYGQESTFVKP